MAVYWKNFLPVTSAQVPDEGSLFHGIWFMMVRSVEAAAQGSGEAVITALRAVDILPVGVVFAGSVGNTMLFNISCSLYTRKAEISLIF